MLYPGEECARYNVIVGQTFSHKHEKGFTLQESDLTFLNPDQSFDPHRQIDLHPTFRTSTVGFSRSKASVRVWLTRSTPLALTTLCGWSLGSLTQRVGQRKTSPWPKFFDFACNSSSTVASRMRNGNLMDECVQQTSGYEGQQTASGSVPTIALPTKCAFPLPVMKQGSLSPEATCHGPPKNSTGSGIRLRFER